MVLESFFDLLSLGDEMGLLFALSNPLNFDEMCIVTNLKYIITVCYDVIILYNCLPMHSFFFPLLYLLLSVRTGYCLNCHDAITALIKVYIEIVGNLCRYWQMYAWRGVFTLSTQIL